MKRSLRSGKEEEQQKTKTRMIKQIGVLLYLIWLIQVIQARRETFFWKVNVVKRPETLPLYFRQIDLFRMENQLTTVKQLTPRSSYFFEVSIVDDYGNTCDDCARELSNIGGYPLVSGTSHQKSIDGSSLNQDWLNGTMVGANKWFIPFSTADSGSLKVIVDTNNMTTPRLYRGSLLLSEFSFSVGISSNSDTSVFSDKPINSIVWPSSLILSKFKCNWAPQSSSIWFCDFDELNAPALMHSEDQLLSTFMGELSVSSTFLSQCRGSNNSSQTKIVRALSLAGSILFHLSNGVVLIGQLDDKENLVLSRVGEGICFDRMFFPSQDAPEFIAHCNYVYLVDDENKKLYRWDEKAKIKVIEIPLNQDANPSLTTVSGWNLSQIQFLGGAATAVSCDHEIFLISNSQTNPVSYRLVKYENDGVEGKWSQLFVFPSFVYRSVTRLFSGQAPLLGPNVGNGIPIPLNLTGMSFHRSLSNDLFVWGNALLYSPDGGENFMSLAAFSDNVIVTSLDSDTHSSFTFSTSDHQIYFGDVGTDRIVQINQPSESETRDPHKHVFPFFDMGNSFRELTITRNENNNTISFVRDTIHIDSLFARFDTESTACPYSSIVFDAPQDPLFLRQKSRFAYLPEYIFLDRHQQYTFKVVLHPASFTALRDLRLSYKLSDPDGVLILSERKEDLRNNYVVYKITVKDVGKQESNYPGKGLKASSVRIFVQDADFSCVASQGDLDRMPLSYSMTIYTGCPPSQRTDPVFNFTKINLFCPKVEEGVPCAYFENALHVDFVTTDLITGAKTLFEDDFFLRVVGGGPTLDSVQPFTDHEIGLYNLDYDRTDLILIWSLDGDILSKKDGVPHMNSKLNNIRWICKYGTPCYGLRPVNGSPAASYYFQFNMTSRGISSDRSYCIRQTTFKVHMYGIPLDFISSVIIVSVIASISFIFTFFFLGYQYRKEQNQANKVGDDNLESIFGNMGDASDFPPPTKKKFAVPPQYKIQNTAVMDTAEFGMNQSPNDKASDDQNPQNNLGNNLSPNTNPNEIRRTSTALNSNNNNNNGNLRMRPVSAAISQSASLASGSASSDGGYSN